jgi:hypothetical protein
MTKLTGKRPIKFDPDLANRVNKEYENMPVPPAIKSYPEGKLSFIEDSELYNEILQYIQTKFPKTCPTITEDLFFHDGAMEGGGAYSAVAIDMFLKENMPQKRIANLYDLEKNIEQLKFSIVPSGLALRNFEGRNYEQAGHLFNQICDRENSYHPFGSPDDLSRGIPVCLSLKGLTLDDESNFNLTEESWYRLKAGCLNWENRTKFSETDYFGLPSRQDKNAPRNILTGNHALSACYLTCGCDASRCDLATNEDKLSGSCKDYRIVLVDAGDSK